MKKNKIGRNEPCPCGSGKKYKKCCINVSGMNLDRVVFPSWYSSPSKDGKEVLWRTSYKNLKNKKVVEDLDNFLSKTQVYSNSCHYISTLLGIEIDDVEVVKGWYGFRPEKMLGMSSEYRFKKQIHFELWRGGTEEEIDERWSLMVIKEGTMIYCDHKTNTFYYRHSWNKCGDKYFDLSTELKSDDNRWVFYLEDEVRDMSKYKSHEVSKKKISDYCLNLMNVPELKSLPHNKLNRVGV